MAIQTFGVSIADELVIKLATPENLTALLNAGAVHDLANNLELRGLPALASFDMSPSNVFRHWHPVKLVEFSLRLSADPAGGSLSMHFDGPGWKLSGINLPAAAIQALVDRLSVQR
jgi:hypothetical protein